MTARTFETALVIAREAVLAHARRNGRGEDIDDSDRAIGIAWMSNLLWEVRADDGGFAGLSDAAFEAFCEANSRYVSRAIAEKALWAREIRWPADAEDEAERARWHEAYARNLAFRAARPEPSEPQPAATPKRKADAAERLKPRDPAAARTLAATIDRLLAPERQHGEAA